MTCHPPETSSVTTTPHPSWYGLTPWVCTLYTDIQIQDGFSPMPPLLHLTSHPQFSSMSRLIIYILYIYRRTSTTVDRRHCCRTLKTSRYNIPKKGTYFRCSSPCLCRPYIYIYLHSRSPNSPNRRRRPFTFTSLPERIGFWLLRCVPDNVFILCDLVRHRLRQGLYTVHTTIPRPGQLRSLVCKLAGARGAPMWTLLLQSIYIYIYIYI